MFNCLKQMSPNVYVDVQYRNGIYTETIRMEGKRFKLGPRRLLGIIGDAEFNNVPESEERTQETTSIALGNVDFAKLRK